MQQHFSLLGCLCPGCVYYGFVNYQPRNIINICAKECTKTCVYSCEPVSVHSFPKVETPKSDLDHQQSMQTMFKIWITAQCPVRVALSPACSSVEQLSLLLFPHQGLPLNSSGSCSIFMSQRTVLMTGLRPSLIVDVVTWS